MEKITFVTDDGGKEEFYVEEQTRINGVNYILVSDSKDDEANAYILKDISKRSYYGSIYWNGGFFCLLIF
jgi:hypothetical protein